MKINRAVQKIFKQISKETREINRISRISTGGIHNTSLFGRNFEFLNPQTFIGQYHEIFIKEIFYFQPTNEDPVILDCGSNIGMSILYFKRSYPNSKILGFEPDPFVFEILKRNVKSFRLENVELINKGIWKDKGKLRFDQDMNDSGHISSSGNIEIDVITLYQYLNKRIDFLKIDIEGSELEVITSLDGCLANVSQVFIEYHSRVSENQNLHCLLDIMQRNFFRFYILNNSVKINKPFMNIKSGNIQYDNLLNICFYR